jgi:cell division protein FtsB
MREQLASVQEQNQKAEWRNEQLANEVRDLKEGLEIIEEKARMELGMVKPNEILVQIAQGSR